MSIWVLLDEMSPEWREMMKKGGTVDNMLRERRTPITEVGKALVAARVVWLDLASLAAGENEGFWSELGGDHEYVFEKTFECFFDAEANGDEYRHEAFVEKNIERPWLSLIFAVVAYSCQALKAEKNNQRETAWTFAADALYWSGVLKCMWAEPKCRENPGVALAKIMHAEHYALEADALKWLSQNGGDKLSPEKAGEKLWLEYSQEVEAETYTKWIRFDRAKKSK